MAAIGQIHDISECNDNSKVVTPAALFKALEIHDEAAVRELLALFRRRDLQWTEMKFPRTGDTALHIATKVCPQPIVELLCESCHRIPFERVNCVSCHQMLEIKNNLGKTCLHDAAEICRAAIVGYLLKQGANVDPMMDGDWTPLMLACSKTGFVAFQTVKILLEHGADPSLKNRDGWTSLHIACRTGWSDSVQALLERRPEAVESITGNGRSPMHLAALHGHHTVVQQLLQAHCPVDPIDACGLTPLHEAVRGGHIQVIRTLKRHGAKLHKVDKKGLSCLHFAAETGRENVLEFLLVECCMFVDAPSKAEKLTALHCAVRAGQTECVKTLLCFGADPRREDVNGRTAQDFLSGLNNEEIEMLLGDSQTMAWQQGKKEPVPMPFSDSGSEISS